MIALPPLPAPLGVEYNLNMCLLDREEDMLCYGEFIAFVCVALSCPCGFVHPSTGSPYRYGLVVVAEWALHQACLCSSRMCGLFIMPCMKSSLLVVAEWVRRSRSNIRLMYDFCLFVSTPFFFVTYQFPNGGSYRCITVWRCFSRQCVTFFNTVFFEALFISMENVFNETNTKHQDQIIEFKYLDFSKER